MPSAKEVRDQIEWESQRRARLAVPSFAGGFLYLLSAVIISAAVNGAPKVGLLQAFAPAFKGELEASDSPRAGDVKFFSSHAVTLIAGSVLAAAAVMALTLVLVFLLDATRFRRPNVWPPARRVVLFGGSGVAIISVIHQIVEAIETHRFAVGHDHSRDAVERALQSGTATVIVEYIGLVAGLSLAVGLIVVLINALRVGLVPRWMMLLGIFIAVLIVLPIGAAELQIVPAFWMVMMGILLAGRWPNKNEPPGWAAGEARPYPSAAQVRAERQAAAGGPAAATAGADAAPAPAKPVVSAPAQAGTSRKRRKRR
jgi:hypothetical protein